MNAAKKTLFFVVNVDWFFLSHRLPIAMEALKRGYDVRLACGVTGREKEIEALGIKVDPLPLSRGRASALEALQVLLRLVSLFKTHRPACVHLVTLKPVLLGGLAARLAGVRASLAAVSGLGFVFLAQGLYAGLRRRAVLALYRLALGGKNTTIVFQNKDDRDSLIGGAGLSNAKVEMIRGSGVDLDAYAAQPEADGPPLVILPARLLADKGVREFAHAARLLKREGLAARFALVGAIDPDNPASLTTAEIDAWVREGVLEAWGHKSDMAVVLGKAHIVALPSYREGLPKALIEAAACGRATITTDVPGCRDAIEPNVTGLLVPVRSGEALARGIAQLLSDPARRQAMGRAGRRLAETAFDVREVVRHHMEIYERLTRDFTP